MPKNALTWLCVKGIEQVSWVYLVVDPDLLNPGLVASKFGKLELIVVDVPELTNPRYGHQN
jgi:hypothetical protein